MIDTLERDIARLVRKYRGKNNLKNVGVDLAFTSEQIEEYLKCKEDYIYFVKTYVKIITLDDGLVPLDLWPYQERMMIDIHEGRYILIKAPRRSSKTTVSWAYILWYILFHSEKTAAILANKEKTAKEILSRLCLAYEYLPMWLQQGVVSWGKESIELENGSKVLAQATSSDAIRGYGINILLLDEFCFLHRNMQEDFYNSVYPTITSGSKTKLIISSTPKGFDLFAKFWIDSEEGRNNFKRFEVKWQDTPGRDEKFKEETIRNTSEKLWRQEFLCEFLGSSNTLIDPMKLRAMAFKNPILQYNGVDLYEHPVKAAASENIKEHIYAMTVDVARGVEGDYSTFCIFDVSTVPYVLVAKFRNNEISPLLFPNIIFQLAQYYNNAFVLIEINDLGQQVADILNNDLEYEYVLMTQAKGRAGQTVGGGYGGISQRIGVNMNKQVKRIGCANLKSLYEGDKLLSFDYDLLQELTTFVETKGSYAAEEGKHDDLAMCCVLFGWLVNQPYFKQMTETDVRSNLYDDNKALLDASHTPFGFQNIPVIETEDKIATIDEFYNLDIHPRDERSYQDIEF